MQSDQMQREATPLLPGAMPDAQLPTRAARFVPACRLPEAFLVERASFVLAVTT